MKFTLDTNILSKVESENAKLFKSIKKSKFDVKFVTVTGRELQKHDQMSQIPDEFDIEFILETGVWGEPPWGEFLWAGANEEKMSDLEAILKIISNGSFPKSGKRELLTDGQRNQLRDAIIFEAHVREKREIFVTTDRKAFLGK